MDATAADTALLVAVVLARFVAPLFIPAFPLPGILACLLLDAADRELFVVLTDLDLSGYQGIDKALDTFYLTVAMLAVLRNWTHPFAARTARVLFYLRLVGVTAFELTGWRLLLLVLPNVFEYFFVLYEAVRSRWSPERLSRRFFLVAAAVIWLVKLPQEYFVHVADLDVTDLVGAALDERPVAAGVLALVASSLVLAVLAELRPPDEAQFRSEGIQDEIDPVFVQEPLQVGGIGGDVGRTRVGDLLGEPAALSDHRSPDAVHRRHLHFLRWMVRGLKQVAAEVAPRPAGEPVQDRTIEAVRMVEGLLQLRRSDPG